ncbi:MAG: hypothetical protein CMJ39_03505 [Phycisphaerae bacterium]|nr:hypothetical protein [Phycisphaerae bacterium]
MADQPANPEPLKPDQQETLSRGEASGLESESLPQSSLIGMKIGSCKLRRVIGSGGMGTVYEAQQEQPRRRVAIKMMKRGITSRSALRRFEFESQTLARLHHPGIAQVYEAGTHDDGAGGVPYFIMEYIPNALTITDYADEKKLGTRERLQLFAKVCDAIQHGHLKGIVHRDIKPGNVLVDSSGQPKIIDFGVARSTDSDLAITTLQTDVGQLLGTLQYMSPEQCAADSSDIDTRSDIYALGVVLYELLAGRLPYDVRQAAIHEAVRMVREEEPTKLSSIDRHLRGDVETIALKALEKERERRYQSAAALEEDIDRYLAGDPISARRATAWYHLKRFACRHKTVFALTGSFVLLLIAATIVSLILMNNAIQWQKQAMLMRDQAIEGQEQAEQQTTVAKRAQAEAEESRVEALRQAYLANLNAASMGLGDKAADSVHRRLQAARHALGNPPLDEMPFAWRHIAAANDDSAYQVDTGLRRPWALAFNDNGTRLTSYHLRGKSWDSLVWDVSTGEGLADTTDSIHDGRTPGHLLLVLNDHSQSDSLRKVIYDLPSRNVISIIEDGEVHGPSFEFSDDGSRLVAFSNDSSYLTIWDVDSGSIVLRLENPSGQIRRVCLSPDGRLIAAVSQASGYGGSWIELKDVDTGELVAQFGDNSNVPESCFDAAIMSTIRFSPDGAQLVAVEAGGDINLMNVQQAIVDRKVDPKTIRSWPLGNIGISNDAVFDSAGGHLVVSTNDDVIRAWDLDSGEILNTFHGQGGSIRVMLISPDGSTLASAGRDGSIRIWDLSDFRDLSEEMSGRTSWYKDFCLSPDGAQIASGNNLGMIDIRDLRTGELIAQLGSYGTHIIVDMVYSPDGMHLASSLYGGEVWVWNTLTGKRVHVLNHGETSGIPGLAFSPDGSLLAQGGREEGVVVWDTDSGEVRYVLPEPEHTNEHVAFSADGSLLAVLDDMMTANGNVSLWDASTGESIEVDRRNTSNTYQIQSMFMFDPRQNIIASGYSDGMVRIIDPVDDALLLKFQAHQGPVDYLDYSPDGSLLATIGGDNFVRVWNTDDGEELLSFTEEDKKWSSLSFSHDGSMLIAADYEDGLSIWDTRSTGRQSVDRQAMMRLKASLDSMVRTWIQEAEDDAEVVQKLQKESLNRTAEEQAALRNLVLKYLHRR